MPTPRLAQPALPTLAALAAAALLAASPALAHTRTFVGSFGPEGAGGRTGSGSLTMEYDEDSSVLAISATFSGLSSPTRVAHIHCCSGPFPATAGVALAGASNAFGATMINFPTGVTGATYNQNFDLLAAATYTATFRNANGGTATGARDALLAAFTGGQAYFNIHTDAFPGGEIRAQIALIPEPGTWAMLAGGLALVGGVAARRRAAA